MMMIMMMMNRTRVEICGEDAVHGKGVLFK